MHLKFIELFGFKTFPDKIRIPFDAGINIIVGPNGCGKTNIVDAIRFILGEQSLKDLRLKNMNDIIFHGSNMRKSSSVALCRGVFENDLKNNFKYKDFSEIMIERRHFKNNETEYRINGITVPYREYLDFFNESGLSKHYSIIDSSKINAILNYKPNELKLFFEEASGITKYKIQKKAASKKLEAAEFNLLRIGDLFGEVEKQLVFLEKASKKLKNYKELENEKKRYDFALYDRTKRKIIYEIEKLVKELDGYSLQLAGAGAKSDSALSGLTVLKTAFDKEDAAYKVALNEKNRLTIDMTKLNSAIEYANMTIKNLDSEISQKSKEIIEQNGLKDRDIEKSASLKNKAAAEESNFAKLREKFDTLNKSVSEKKEFLSKTKNEIDAINDEIFAAVEKSQNYNNKLIFNNKNIKNIETRINDTKGSISKISQEIAEGTKILSGKINQSDAAAKIIESLRDAQSEISLKSSELLEELNECKSKKDALEKELIKIGIDISGLSDFIDNREGFSEGTKKLLCAKRDYEAYPLSDIMEIERGFEDAVWEGARDMLETVFVNGIEDAQKALDYAGSNKTGEIRIFVPGKSKNKLYKDGKSFDALCKELDIIPLADKIKLNSQKIVLGDIGINFYYSKNTDTILKHIKLTGFFPEVNIVTGQGIIFFSNGLIIGGKNKNIESQNLFLNKNKLSQYKQLKLDKENEFDKENSLYISKQSEINGLGDKAAKLSEALKIKEMEEITVKNDIKHLEGQSVKLRERLNILKKELNSLESEKEEISEEEKKIKKEILVSENESKLQTAEKTFMEKKLRDLENEFENIKEDETSLKIELNSSQQNINFLKKQIKDLDSVIFNYDKRINSLIAQKEKLKKDFEETASGLSEKQKNVSFMDESIAKLDIYIKDAEIKMEDLKKNINIVEKEFENADRQRLNLEKKKDAVQTYININKEKLAELDSGRELSGLPVGISEQDEAFILKNIESMQDEDIKKNIEESGRKITELGDVNMNAAKEYGDALERLDFLGKQKKDLISSIESLQGIIKKLDAVSKEKFNSSLSQIRREFSELFTFLFGGGHADILNVADNAYEAVENERLERGISGLSGMEINAQIPGKKFSGINILSQGERVLVAVSLLFAIFLVKKTPFCVIDEVDAPLDYANNARYNKLIMEISGYSQIILVTHNKKTMEIGKNIFGVTSKHAGISGIVSVSMN